MDAKKIAEILNLASETHHSVWSKEKGNDSDWASWYSEWLLEHSDLSALLEKVPVKSELTYLLVKFDKEYREQKRELSWQEYYAQGIINYLT